MRSLLSQFKDKSHVIWDWNGTLLDDVAISVAAVGDVLTGQGLPQLTQETYLQRFRFPVADYYAEIGIDMAKAPFAELSQQFIRGYTERLGQARLFDGVHELLTDLAAAGIGCSVLSAAYEPELRRLLQHYGIAAHFTHVFGLSDTHAHGKLERGQQLMAALGLPPAQVMLVGDTDHDLAVGAALGVDVLLVTAGHQHEERLTARHDRVARRRG